MQYIQDTRETRRGRKARSLTAGQFRALLKELHEPFATMALLCVCLGLRISEALALRWDDVDWLQSLAGVYWELRKMNRKFLISHSVTGTILYYPRPLLRRNPCKRQGF